MNMSALNTLVASSPHGMGADRLPTNVGSRNNAVHRWYNFIAGFSPEFVRACVDMHGHNPTRDLVLLDPFSGCGTTPVAARLLGMSAHAYEPHPFFAAISEAKANSHKYWPALPHIQSAILTGISRGSDPTLSVSSSVSAFLDKMFRVADLQALHAARLELNRSGLGENPLAVLILSRMLDHCCLAATDGIYKAPTSTKRACTPSEAFEKVMSLLLEDASDATCATSAVRIHCSSSELMPELADDTVDLVVTSPPYLNNFDFAEMTRMYLYFWGTATSWGEITDRIRSNLLVNTTTALRGHKDNQERYRESLSERLLPELDAAVASLRQKRSEKAGKKEYDLLIYPYLSQMQSILRECARVCRPGAPFHMMVSDAALYGVHLSAPQWLAQIMSEAGFTDIQCELARPRGHRWVLAKREGSATGLGEYHVYGRAS